MRHRLLMGCGLWLLVTASCVRRDRADVERNASLEAAAREIVGFLRAEVPFERLRLADSVTLRLAPDGGGAQRTLPREALRDRRAWTVGDGSRQEYSLVPFEGPAELTVRPGRHLTCMERTLGSVAPDLAELPHVGTRLKPPDATSCLQSWSLTLVFTPDADRPTLIAAVYDQWEW